MAGQGWREWVAGEQLTDEKMQQFLMDQAVMRFANASARDSALSEVLSEGMVAYLDDINTVEVYDGSEWTELTGDPDIFTQGTAGQYLQSNGTAGVEWSDIDEALPRVAGLHFGRPGQKSAISTLADTSYSVALGYNASQGASRPNASLIGNTTIGGNTGASITTGTNNVIVGGEAGLNVTTGQSNVLIGTSASQQMTTGQNNVVIGQGAGFDLTNQQFNVFIGQAAGSQNKAFSSVAIGALALQNMEDPSAGSVAVGFRALRNATGSSNTAVGDAAGVGVTSGEGNTCLGLGAGIDKVGTGENNTIIGFLSSPSATNVSNQITLGNASISSLRCQVTSISALSDIRDKSNVQDSTYGLELINQLRPVTFDWNMRDGAKVGVPDVGFIAQELAAVEDNYDAERLALTLRDNPDRLEATPGRLIPILVKAIQELSARIEELENER